MRGERISVKFVAVAQQHAEQFVAVTQQHAERKDSSRQNKERRRFLPCGALIIDNGGAISRRAWP